MDILGIGECMIELDAEGTLDQSDVFRRQVGGDVYNTLVACSRLGSRAGFCTRVALDGFGQVLLRHFEENRIDTRWVQGVSHGVNGVYFIAHNSQGGHAFVYYRKDTAASQITPQQITPAMVSGASIVYATGVTQAISSTARQAVLRAFDLARSQGRLVAYDPNYRPNLWNHTDQALEALTEVLPYVDVILPSLADLQPLFGFADVAHALEFFRLRGVPIVIVKQGEQGITLGFRNHQEHLAPWPVERVVDTVGAGDAFNGGFLHGLLQQRSLVDCARIGLMVAAKSLESPGPIAGLPDGQEIDNLMRQVACS